MLKNEGFFSHPPSPGYYSVNMLNISQINSLNMIGDVLLMCNIRFWKVDFNFGGQKVANDDVFDTKIMHPKTPRTIFTTRNMNEGVM